MITWMQKRRKLMLTTMWVAVITFIGAGAVDWGGSSYGSKATSLAKVGEIQITPKELNRQYSAMYRQYNQMMGGKLEPEMAKKLGLEDQAMKMLIQQALMLNLAQDYEIIISDEELALEVEKIESFHKDGAFDKTTYIKALKANNYSTQDFETSLKRDLTIQKVSKYLKTDSTKDEQEPFLTSQAVADKIDYLILDTKNIPVGKMGKDAIQSFWELKKAQFVTQAKITVEEITVKAANKKFNDDEIANFYKKESFNFTDDKGEIKTLEAAKADIISALNDKATKKSASLLYIDWKKDRLDPSIAIKKHTFKANDAPYTMDITEKVQSLQAGKYMKPVKVGDDYIIVRLLENEPSRTKTFAEAKSEVYPLFIADQKRQRLQSMAVAQLDIFKGTQTKFITKNDTAVFHELTSSEAKQALNKLFTTDKPSGQIIISNDKIMLYRITEQKLLFKPKSINADVALEKQIDMLKEQTRLTALVQALNAKYKTEIFYK
ncbi:MAG: peptidylprolyl isomerase [Thiovulaceae bacterium]|nr:peptidylprolyl isomerase [Sulfurimonadaceae bacterium]